MGEVPLPHRIQKSAILVPVGNRNLDLVAPPSLKLPRLFAGDGEFSLLYLDQDVSRILWKKEKGVTSC